MDIFAFQRLHFRYTNRQQEKTKKVINDDSKKQKKRRQQKMGQIEELGDDDIGVCPVCQKTTESK